MIIPLNSKLSTVAKMVMDNAVPNYYAITCIFYSPTNSELRLTLNYINFLDIVQKFSSNYMDEISLNCTLPIKDVLSILQNYQDLRCTLVLQKSTCNPFVPVKGVLPIKLTFRVIINNADDLLKKYQKNEIQFKEDNNTLESQYGRTVTLECQLFEDVAYELRHKQFNGLLNNTTIEKTLYYICNMLGITNIKMVKPDNTRVYKSISLPPMLDISNAFDFIQQRYGIYSKGLCVYYTNGTLYIYPRFDINPKSDSVIRLYKVQENYGLGHHCFHYLDEDKTLHVLGTSPIQNKSVSVHGSENKGNYKVALRTDMTLDCVRDVQGTNGTYQEQNALSCGLKSDRTAITGAKNAKYETSSNNAYQLATDMLEEDCEILATAWILAEPNIIYPGQKLVYQYEDMEAFKSRTGTIEEIHYSIHQLARTSDHVYQCMSKFAVRLDPSKD